MDFKKKFNRIKTKKRIIKSKNKIISGVLLVILWMALIILAVVLNNQTKEPTEELETQSVYTELEGEALYGQREIVEFPFDKLDDLPDEPDWKKENVFGELLDIKNEENDIQQWYNNINFSTTGVVNKSGDPISLMYGTLGSMYGEILFKNNENLVVVYHDVSYNGALMRMEVLPESIILDDGQRYCCTVEQIVCNAYYLDYKNHNTLYYYVDEGYEENITPKILMIDKEVQQVLGYCKYNYFTEFPIIQKDQEIYTYILEDVEEYSSGDCRYKTNCVKLKKITLTNLEGIYKTDGSVLRINLDTDENSWVTIFLEKNKVQLLEGEHVSVLDLINKGAIKLQGDLTHSYHIYLDKSKGYDNDMLY